MDMRKHGVSATVSGLPLASLLMLSAVAIVSGCSSSDDENPGDLVDDQPGTTINVTNHAALVEYVFGMTNALSFAEVSTLVDRIYDNDMGSSDANLDFLTESSSTFDPDLFITRITYTCSDGGTYEFADTGSALGGGSGAFAACRFDDMQLDGSYNRSNELIKFVFSPGFSTSTTYEALSLTSDLAQTVSVIDGVLNRFNGENEITENWDITQYSESSADGKTLVSDATINLYVGNQPDNPDFIDTWKRTISSDYIVQGPDTGNAALTVITEEIFSSNEPATGYTSGVLLVQAADGSMMRVVAANGDPDTFQVDVTGDGSMTSFTLAWDGALRLRCLQDPQTEDAAPENCL
ncbi:MAG: hypothetical protein HKN42_18595 [Granulosicoccus sp.]|nr:hypothetical protein [Granulosicoccus sp.]